MVIENPKKAGERLRISRAIRTETRVFARQRAAQEVGGNRGRRTFVGHQTVHAGDVAAQNRDARQHRSAARRSQPRVRCSAIRSRHPRLQVYVRNGADLPLIQSPTSPRVGPPTPGGACPAGEHPPGPDGTGTRLRRTRAAAVLAMAAMQVAAAEGEADRAHTQAEIPHGFA